MPVPLIVAGAVGAGAAYKWAKGTGDGDGQDTSAAWLGGVADRIRTLAGDQRASAAPTLADPNVVGRYSEAQAQQQGGDDDDYLQVELCSIILFICFGL